MILALLLLLQADFTDLFRAAYEERRRAGHPKAAESAVDLALYLAGRGDYAQASPFFDLVMASPAPDATVLHNWAAGIERQSPEQAERLYRRALSIREKKLSIADTELASTRLNLALLLTARGDYTGAEPLAQAALAAFERSKLPVGGRVGMACGALGAARATKGDVAGAERYFRRALAVAEKVHGPRSEEAADALENLADLLSQTGRESAALPLLERAKRIRAVHANPVVREPQ